MSDNYTITDGDRRIVRNAIQILENDGWTQNAYKNYSGSYCAIGALTAAWGGDVPMIADDGYSGDIQLTESSGLAQEIANALRDSGAIDQWEMIPDWNDAPERTQDDVISVLSQFA